MTGKHEKQQHVMKTHSNDQSTPDASQLPGSGGPLPQQIHEQNPRSMEDAASSDSSAGRGAPPATSDTLGRVCTDVSYLGALEGTRPPVEGGESGLRGWVGELYAFLRQNVHVRAEGDALTVEFRRQPPDRQAQAAWLTEKAARARRAGKSGRAARLYAQALHLQPDRADAWFGLALAHGMEGDDVSARAAALKAARLCPQEADYVAELADLAAGAQDAAAAEHLARLALRFNPRHPSACNTLSWALLATGRATEGLAELRRTIRAHPADAVPRFYLSALLLRTGRPAAALRMFREVLVLQARNRNPLIRPEDLSTLCLQIMTVMGGHRGQAEAPDVSTP